MIPSIIGAIPDDGLNWTEVTDRRLNLSRVV